MTDNKPSSVLKSWSTRAINLPEHADNPIHTDEGAIAAGYPSAIVAGTTVYAYLTRPAASAWGEAWLSGGGGELRLKRAVLHDELVECGVSTEAAQDDAAQDDAAQEEGTPTLEAVGNSEIKATFELWKQVEAPEMRSGDDLPTWELELTEAWVNYGIRCGDDLGLYDDLGVAHPAMWPALANTVFIRHMITGSWIHTRSKIYHQGLARLGDDLRIESTVIDRFETRAGQRAVVDMAMFANDKPVARLEHEALVSLNEG